MNNWTDIPVGVLHEVCRLAALKPYEFGDHLRVRQLDVMDAPKTDIPSESMRHIINIWMQREGTEATLDWLLQALDKMGMLYALEGKLKQEMQEIRYTAV